MEAELQKQIELLEAQLAEKEEQISTLTSKKIVRTVYVIDVQSLAIGSRIEGFNCKTYMFLDENVAMNYAYSLARKYVGYTNLLPGEKDEEDEEGEEGEDDEEDDDDEDEDENDQDGEDEDDTEYFKNTYVSGIVCKTCNYELPVMLMSEHLDVKNPKNRCLCNDNKKLKKVDRLKMSSSYSWPDPYYSCWKKYSIQVRKDKLEYYKDIIFQNEFSV